MQVTGGRTARCRDSVSPRFVERGGGTDLPRPLPVVLKIFTHLIYRAGYTGIEAKCLPTKKSMIGTQNILLILGQRSSLDLSGGPTLDIETFCTKAVSISRTTSQGDKGLSPLREQLTPN
ncbi:hypothetical protein RRG08_034098 [Elysia crispata]|uniref:Uncharacterized protein n=1 Tax=Elysia crispata TaxID=231223 RepID=A0AAE0ZCM4_9GAST|nr:hypothetical protein RRG08_034098 [Elysia crispata]